MTNKKSFTANNFMNRKNNVLTLISATTLICNVFSSYVNAKGYAFTSSNDIKPCEVITKNGKNLLSKVTDIIDLGTMRSEEKREYAFLVDKKIVEETEEAYSETDKMLKIKEIEDYKKKIEEAKDAIKDAKNIEEKAKAEKKAVEIAAELRGECKDKINSYELLEGMRGLVVENSKMIQGIDARYKALGEGFKIEEMAEGKEDAANLNEALKKTLCTKAGAKPANHKFKIVLMGDKLNDEVYEGGGELAGHKEYKYKVLSTGEIDGVNKTGIGSRIEAARKVAVEVRTAGIAMVKTTNAVAVNPLEHDNNDDGLQINAHAGKAAKIAMKYIYELINNLSTIAVAANGVDAAEDDVKSVERNAIDMVVFNAFRMHSDQAISVTGKAGADTADGVSNVGAIDKAAGAGALDKAVGAIVAVIAAGKGSKSVSTHLKIMLKQVSAVIDIIKDAGLNQNNIVNAINIVKGVAETLYDKINGAGEYAVDDGDDSSAIKNKTIGALNTGNAANAQIVAAAKSADVIGINLANVASLGDDAKLGVDFSTAVGAGVGGLTEVNLDSANLKATQTAIPASVPITQAKVDEYVNVNVNADADGGDAAIACRGDATHIHNNNNNAITTRKGTVGTQAAGNNFHYIDNLFDGNSETVESQQKRFAKYAYEWFNFRAKDFIKAAEEAKAKNVAKKQAIASYLGACEVNQSINKFGDYNVEYIAEKGGEAVTLNSIKEQMVYLEDKKEWIKLLTVELIASSAEKDTEIKGKIKITSNAQGSKIQEIEVRGKLEKGPVEDTRNITGDGDIKI